MTPGEQARVFLAMTLCGAALGAAYDGLYILRHTALRDRAGQNALDLLFGVFCAGAIILSALQLRIQANRWYVLLGAAAGMGGEQLVFGTLLRRSVAIWRRRAKKTNERTGKREKHAGKSAARKNS